MKPTKKKTVKPHGGTVKKYLNVINILRDRKEPLKGSTNTFSKEHNVSTNLIYALTQMGCLTRTKDGYVWNSKAPNLKSESIASKARIIMNEITNKRKPTSERPKGVRKSNGRKKKDKITVKNVVPNSHAILMKKTIKAIKTKMIPKVKRTYAKKPQQPTMTSESIRVKLARKFMKIGQYQDALDALGE